CMKFHVMIIDDERLARAEVRRALADYPEFETTGEAKNIKEAREQIETLKPDLIFLDIQMPGGSGFDLLESLETVPAIVFTTAFDEYAVQAFETEALDYLVKPLRKERFAKTIERVRKKLNSETEPPYERQLFVKDGNRCHLVRVDELFLVESLDNYVRLYFGNKTTCIKRSLNQMEKILDSKLFFRISRTQIVNTSFIRDVHALPKGRLTISLQTGETLGVSSRQSVLFKRLKQP
ncbi:MAG: LytR/AlgR family response regulator transcription factor, partial [Flavisolibacter sp.]